MFCKCSLKIFVLKYEHVITLKKFIPKERRNTKDYHYHRYDNGFLICCDTMSLWIIVKLVLENERLFLSIFYHINNGKGVYESQLIDSL